MRLSIYRLQILPLLIIALQLGTLSPAIAQEETNFSGLKGQVLAEAERIESGVQSLVGSLLSGDKVKGRIVSVTVTEDSEHRLVVQVKYSDFEKERKIWGEVRNNERKIQREILTSSADVKPDSGDTELVFNLSDRLPEGAQLESAFLYLYIGRPQKRTPSLVKAYYLGKKWQIEIMPENIVLKITPKPVGSAASLTQTKSFVMPVKKIVLTDSKLFKKTAVPISQPKIQAPLARPKPTNLSVRLQAGMGYYVVAEGGGGGRVLANTKKTITGTMFTLVDINGGQLVSGEKVYLKTSNGKNYVVAEGGGGGIVKANRTVPREWETFIIRSATGQSTIKLGDTVSLQAYKRQFLSAVSVGNRLVSATGQRVGSNERFKLVSAYLTVSARSMAVQRSTLIARKVDTKPKPAAKTLKSAQFRITDQKRLVMADKFVYGVNKNIQDKNGKGPSAQPIYLLNEMRSDVSIEFEDILHVWPQVYQDQNPESGIFYFLPRAYHLKWTPDEGYGMRMLYFASQEEEEEGDVNVELLVDAGIDSKEYEFAKDLVLAYTARHPGTKFTELRPLPIDKAPEVSIAGGLQHTFNIPPEKIIITAISDALGQVHISLVTDWITKENLQLALFEDMGINGMLTLTPAGSAMEAQQRPIKVTVADHRTLGRIYWTRGQKWRNQAPYPVHLKYLHVLSLQNNIPIIYSWNLDNTEVSPMAQVEWDSRYIPKWLDGTAKFMWLDYKVEKSCDKCDEKVIAEITGGVTSVSADNITYETITPLADTGAYKIFIRTRSMYLHPTSRELKELPELPLNEDEQEYKIGPIYKVDRKTDEAPSGEPLFEYFITVVMPDGTMHKATKWLPSESLRIMIGQVQIKEALGYLPKKDR
jgi:hypothetical protein